MKKRKNLPLIITLAVTYVAVWALQATGIVNDYSFAVIVTIGINIILATSLNLVTGFTGQFSLGHAGFMSIGAYTCALITQKNPTIPGFLLGVAAGATAAALVGVLVGLPTLRLRGDYLAIATLGMAEIIRVVFLNLEITNGAAGLSFLPQFVNWNWLFLFTAGTLVLLRNFLNSSPGRACISVREDEIAAESMGVNTTKYKVTAFSMGAFFAGVAGALYTSYFFFIKPDPVQLQQVHRHFGDRGFGRHGQPFGLGDCRRAAAAHFDLAGRLSRSSDGSLCGHAGGHHALPSAGAAGLHRGVGRDFPPAVQNRTAGKGRGGVRACQS